MRQLYLRRHAKSSWDDPDLSDRERPLAPRGERAADAMAEHLEAEGIRPELVLCSPARRTRQTLERVQPSLGDPRVVFGDDLYGASGGELLDRLRDVDDRTATVMLIGHNPAIQELALSLAAAGADLESVRRKFPTGALATLTVPGRWRELAEGTAELAAFTRPKQLGRA